MKLSELSEWGEQVSGSHLGGVQALSALRDTADPAELLVRQAAAIASVDVLVREQGRELDVVRDIALEAKCEVARAQEDINNEKGYNEFLRSEIKKLQVAVNKHEGEVKVLYSENKMLRISTRLLLNHLQIPQDEDSLPPWFSQLWFFY